MTPTDQASVAWLRKWAVILSVVALIWRIAALVRMHVEAADSAPLVAVSVLALVFIGINAWGAVDIALGRARGHWLIIPLGVWSLLGMLVALDGRNQEGWTLLFLVSLNAGTVALAWMSRPRGGARPARQP